MVILTYSVSFKCIATRSFSKWRLNIFSGGNHPLPQYPPSLTAYYLRPTPPKGVPGYPIFFFVTNKMTVKDVGLVY